VIEAQAGENKIPSLYSNMGALPSAGSYHGMFAHVHATGRGYFAHAGNWLELVNKEVNGVVGTGTERYNIGPVDLTTLDVSGISTFAGNVDINADIDVDGHTNLDNVSIAGVTTTSGHIYINADNKKLIVGQHSDIQIFNDGSNSRIENGSGQLIIKSPILAIQSSGTNQIVSRDLAEVDLYYNGVKKLSTASSGINVVGTTTSTQLAITGVSTFTGAIDANGDLDVDGHTNLDNVSIAGFTTITQDLDVDGHTNLDNVNVSGASTFSNDASFNGGAYAVYIMPGSDIRFANGNWTGEQAGKIQHSSNKLYIQSGTNGTQIRRADGQASWEWQTNGHFIPGLNSNVNIGESAKRVLNIYTDNLDVDSHTNLDNVSIAGVTTFAANTRFNSSITAGGGTGTNGQYLKTTGSGVEWATFPSLRTRQTFTASAGQTTFSFNYTVNFLDVFVNGV
ncbi:MAG: hypothetical protein VXY93_10885, partial [Pseudomonadota bacterium]|nr:hypothetical protein [Pseudomonadota bacterium]